MKKLSKKELKKLTTKLKLLEDSICSSYGLQQISGGFVNIKMTNYNDKTIDVEIKSGIQNDVENSSVSEDAQLDRETLELIN